MRILVIEDDVDAAEYLTRGLKEQGHHVFHQSDGNGGLQLALKEEFDVLVVDRMLPGLNGMSVIAALRAANIQTPILILSGLGEVEDRVEGLTGGADDYLVKPFSFSELLARLEILTRRGRTEQEETVLRVDNLELDRLKRRVSRDGQTITLQPREFRLLEYLMQHADQIVTRTMLLENVWDYHFDPQTNVLDVHISRLRSKIDKDFEKSLLHTVRGSGYRLSATD